MNIKEKIQKINNTIPTIFLVFKDSETPIFTKIISAITIAYILSPIDIIPDFIPFLGYLDDLIILPVLIFLIYKSIPKDIWERCKIKSKELTTNNYVKKWYYAIPIILFWIIIFAIIAMVIVRNIH